MIEIYDQLANLKNTFNNDQKELLNYLETANDNELSPIVNLYHDMNYMIDYYNIENVNKLSYVEQLEVILVHAATQILIVKGDNNEI